MNHSILLSLCMVFLCMGTVRADNDLNTDQTRLRSEIQSYLHAEGYKPEIDEDGDIMFKKEGTIYYVSINPVDENPMYVILFRIFNYPQGYSRNTVVLATAELNRYKGVKVLCLDSSIRIQSDLFMADAHTFAYAFEKLMRQIEFAVEDFIDECDKVVAGN